MESLTREKDHQAENEKIKLQARIGEIAEEVSKKILQKEIKLREESQMRYAQIEQVGVEHAVFSIQACCVVKYA